jgi:ornithine cyclodeaminase
VTGGPGFLRRGSADPGSWLTGALDEPHPERLLYLDRSDVVRCLQDIDPVAVVAAALRDHHAGRTVLPSEAYMPWTNDAGAYTRSIGMPGAVLPAGAERAYGMKVINASVTNPRTGLERAGGLGLCFDPQTARVTAVMEVGVLSAVRTAAVTALALEAVGWPNPSSVAVIGCGTQARLHVALLLHRCRNGLPLLVLHDVRPGAADALAAHLGERYPDLECTAAGTAATAMADAEVVLLLTTAATGYVPPSWIPPTSVVVNVSLSDLTDEVFLNAKRIYVDDVGLIRDNPRRPLGRLLNEGRLAERAGPGRPGITATLGELLAAGVDGPDRPGDGYVVVNPFGLGVLDVALFDAVRRCAEATGVGQWLRTC